MISPVVLRWIIIGLLAMAAWSVAAHFAGSIFLACAAVAGWRLWRVASGAPVMRYGAPRGGQQEVIASVVR